MSRIMIQIEYPLVGKGSMPMDAELHSRFQPFTNARHDGQDFFIHPNYYLREAVVDYLQF